MSQDPYLASICREHGVFLRREAEEVGYTQRLIDALIKRGVWQRVRWGAFVYGEDWQTLGERERYGLRCRAAYRRMTTQVALSHTSSAHLWGAPLWEVELDQIHLTRMDGNTQRRAAGVVTHRGSILDGDLAERDGLLVTSPTRAALEVAMLAPDMEHALVEVDHFLRHGLTTKDALRARFVLMDRWPRTLRLDMMLSLADGRSESVAETRVRYLCWAQHLPTPVLNHPIRDADGTVLYRVDFAWPDLGVFVEFDGREKYDRHRREGESLDDFLIRERRRESRIRELTGWVCVRLTWADLYRPEQTAARIRSQFRPVAA